MVSCRTVLFRARHRSRSKVQIDSEADGIRLLLEDNFCQAEIELVLTISKFRSLFMRVEGLRDVLAVIGINETADRYF